MTPAEAKGLLAVIRAADIQIVFGPQRTGKSLHSVQLQKLFGSRRLRDEWDGRARLSRGDLAITNEDPPARFAPLIADAGYVINHSQSNVSRAWVSIDKAFEIMEHKP